MKIKLLFIICFIISLKGFSQSAPFNIQLEPLSIPGLGGIQSFAFGQHDGKWLIIGGRLDGLHQRQPFAAFNKAGHNTQLIVIDPVSKQKWSAPLTSLSNSLQEQLSSSNMEFKQSGKMLYLVGGYGFSEILKDHTTYGFLTAVDVSSVIHAVINHTAIAAFFRQISDPQFAITGGRLEKIDDDFYLVGGQKFIGRYNPMGPDHGPGFMQEYSNQIRKFSIKDNGADLLIKHFLPITDSANLHRRDYNLTAQIFPDGREGLTAFSGVFQYENDLPFLEAVNIDKTGHTTSNDFWQYYNHYHCANIPIYSSSANEMHSVFFGGIAQYFDSDGILTQDNNVPFIKTIARVSRDANGRMAEYKLPIEMPALLGAGSEFIPLENLPKFSNGVIKLDELKNDPTLIGYIYGGINSKESNIFFTTGGTESSSSNQIFKVFLSKNNLTANHKLNNHKLNEQSIGSLKLMALANPVRGIFNLKYHATKTTDVKISIHDLSGKRLVEKTFKNVSAGDHKYATKMKSLFDGGKYILTVETSYEKATQKIIVDP